MRDSKAYFARAVNYELFFQKLCIRTQIDVYHGMGISLRLSIPFRLCCYRVLYDESPSLRRIAILMLDLRGTFTEASIPFANDPLVDSKPSLLPDTHNTKWVGVWSRR